jgi:hypothetical protein
MFMDGMLIITLPGMGLALLVLLVLLNASEKRYTRQFEQEYREDLLDGLLYRVSTEKGADKVVRAKEVARSMRIYTVLRGRDAARQIISNRMDSNTIDPALALTIFTAFGLMDTEERGV